jgi:hypothetical protein
MTIPQYGKLTHVLTRETYCGWKKSCTTKRMVETQTKNGMFTIYQLVLISLAHPQFCPIFSI